LDIVNTIDRRVKKLILTCFNFAKGFVVTSKTVFLTEELHQYWVSLVVKEHPVLSELRSATAELGAGAQMQIAPEQGQFMGFLLQLIGAKTVLELGTFTGYSSLAMALALPDEGRVLTCDHDSVSVSVAQEFWRKAQMDHKIQVRLGEAQQTLQELIRKKQPFDFIFIDADKVNIIEYYLQSKQLISKHGLIAIDNVFRNGKSAQPSQNSESVRAVQELNAMISNDSSVISTLVPIGDGLSLVRKC
jgi:predicted O-methyltransferase YrrM